MATVDVRLRRRVTFAKELAILDGESPELREAVVVGDVGDA